MDQKKYRPDIDGLRALAVLSVLFYHVGFSGFEGGFVGVDVFFVISGFLITRLIKDEIAQTGGFKFGDFYIRRARRLFPSLAFTLVLSLVLAAILFSPSDFARFGGALFHAILSISNFYFWNESGYFDAEATIKPLLHTWSLSVEEQFYLFWPILIVLLVTKFKTMHVLAILSLVGVASFLLNLVFLGGEYSFLPGKLASVVGAFSDGRATIFYLTPFRIFEFAIGAVLVWATGRMPNNKILLDLIFLLGLALVIYPIVSYTEETVFPAYNALAPCLGTALMIYSGMGAKYASRIVNNNIAVKIGLVSYSLYLIHWPIIVFYEYYKLAELSDVERVAICLVSILSAFLMYHWIEKPFRRPAKAQAKVSNNGFAICCLFVALVFTVPAAHIWANDGWPWRFSTLQNSDILKLDELRQETINYNLQNIQYPTFTTGSNRVLVVGDSHATDVSNGLHRKLAPEYEVRLLGVEEKCWSVRLEDLESEPDPQCRRQLEVFSKALTTGTADYIVIANWYEIESLSHLENFLTVIRGVNRNKDTLKILFFGKSVGFGRNFHHEAIQLLQQGKTVDQINAVAFQKFFRSAERQDEQSASIISGLDGVSYVSRAQAVCRNSSCEFLINRNNILVWDGSHMTLNGIDIVTDRMLSQNPGIFSFADK